MASSSPADRIDSRLTLLPPRGGLGTAVALPLPLTATVGREREIAVALSLLARPEVRLLTLTGPGGIGKTRLAIEVARAATDLADGARFVSLAAVPEAGLVAGAVLHALEIKDEGAASEREALQRALQHNSLLLVLDNFEHVVDEAPFLLDLLAACPGLKILVTSRILLRVTGEFALPVPPLSLRGRDGEVAPLDSEAVMLFGERARAINPAFSLTDEVAPLVAEVCRLLDGLPLAIELAAAQSAVLPPAALLGRIQAHLPLPVTGPRDAPARLRTIADAVAWSYDLLTPEEQHLFRQVSIFAGGFTLDAAERVTEGAETLILLSSLVDKSLLQQEAWEGEARFVMLETIRAFAGDRLAASGEADAIGDAHAAWALELAQRHELAIALPDGERRLRRMEVDHANLRAALVWLERRETREDLLRLAAAMGGFWIVHSHAREGRDWLERALADPLPESSVARGRAEISLGRLRSMAGDVERADRLLTDGIARLRTEQDAAWIAFALIRQAAVANQRGEHDRSEALLSEALDLGATIPDAVISAAVKGTVLANLGVAAHGRGDFDLALARHEEALRICRELGYTLGAVRSLRDLGDVERDRGDLVRSLAHYREALELLGERADLHILVDALEGAALAAAAWQQPTAAARLLGAAETFRELRGGAFIFPADQAAHERTLAAIRAVLDESKVDAAWTAGRQLSVAGAVAEVRALVRAEAGPAEMMPLADPAAVNLSSRETDVLRLLVAGLPDRAIAAELFVSVRTVEAHVGRIFTKLGVRTRTAAVGAAIAAGLVDTAPPSG